MAIKFAAKDQPATAIGKKRAAQSAGIENEAGVAAGQVGSSVIGTDLFQAETKASSRKGNKK